MVTRFLSPPLTPQLAVGDTLYFAALARTPREIPGGMSREEYATHLRPSTVKEHSLMPPQQW
jgi:hypothetical protein